MSAALVPAPTAAVQVAGVTVQAVGDGSVALSGTATLTADDVLNLCDALMAARDERIWPLADGQRLEFGPHAVRWIVGRVAERFAVPPEDIFGYGRTNHVLRARHVAMFLVRELTSGTAVEIGRAFGRDHTTVLHACAKVQVRVRHDEGTQRLLGDLRREVLA